MEIELTQGKVAIVDSEDAYLGEHKWQYNDTKRDGNGYAIRSIYSDGGVRRLYMHRVVIGATGKQLVRHLNGNHLDNRRQNLALTTASARAARARSKPGATGYRGVSGIMGTDKCRALITDKGSTRQLGTFDDPRVAALIYDIAAIEYWGRENAVLNFPDIVPTITLRKALDEHRRMRIRQRHEEGLRTAPYVGVSRHTAGQYRATIQKNGHQEFLGSFDTPEEAAHAYDDAAREYRGSSAFVNFPWSEDG